MNRRDAFPRDGLALARAGWRARETTLRQEIDRLGQLLAQRDEAFAALHQQVAGKDHHLADLSARLAEKEADVRTLWGRLGEAQERLRREWEAWARHHQELERWGLDAVRQELERRAAIERSIAWRLIQRLRRLT